MKKLIIFMFACGVFSSTALAGVEERGQAVKASVAGKSDYHAEMARGLVDVAEDEMAQRESDVARAFMDEAEKHASQAGGK